MRPIVLLLLLLLLLVTLAACSNAASPFPDALDRPPGDGGADARATDAAPTRSRILVINEVAPGESPDWFEVVNATTAPVQLADFVFVDVAGDLTKAVAFPPMLLGPGAFFAQDVDGTTVPFKLGADEELWIYGAIDHLASDGVDWAAGDGLAGSAFARNPDVFGAFVTTTKPTRGAPNDF